VAHACGAERARPEPPPSPADTWPKDGRALVVRVTDADTFDRFARSHAIALRLDVRDAATGAPATPPAPEGVALTVAGRYEPARVSVTSTGGRDAEVALVWPDATSVAGTDVRSLLAGAGSRAPDALHDTLDRAVARLAERALEATRRRVVLVVTDETVAPKATRQARELADALSIEVRTIVGRDLDATRIARLIGAEIRALDAELVLEAVLPDDLTGFSEPVDLVVELLTPDGAYGRATIVAAKLPLAAID